MKSSKHAHHKRQKRCTFKKAEDDEKAVVLVNTSVLSSIPKFEVKTAFSENIYVAKDAHIAARPVEDSKFTMFVGVKEGSSYIIRPATVLEAIAHLPTDPDAKKKHHEATPLELAKLFGSRRIQASIAANEARRVRVDATDATAVDALDQSTRTAGEALKEELEANQNSQHATIPPHDLTATEPANIYPLEGLLPTEEELERIPGGKWWAELGAAELAEIRADARVPALVRTALEQRETPPGHLLLELLFVGLSMLRGKESTLNEDTHGPTISWLGRRFKLRRGRGGKYTLPRNGGPLLPFLMVLAWHLHGFRIKLPIVASDTCQAPAKIGGTLRMLGAQINRDAEGKRIAVLRAPLRLPKLKKKGRSGR